MEMAINIDTPIESAFHLRRLIQEAVSDPRVDPAPLVATLVYGGLVPDRAERVRLATSLVGLPQASTADLRTLASGIDLSIAADQEIAQFVDDLLDHHAATPDVIVTLIHSHDDTPLPYSPVLADYENFAVTVARATARAGSVRSRSAVLFVEFILEHADSETLTQLQGLLQQGNWTESLWSAYQVASALADVDVANSVSAVPEWAIPLEPVRA